MASLPRNLDEVKQALHEAGLPALRFHDLRHSAATILISMGVNSKVVQERLGHSTTGITLGVYGHVTKSMQRDAMQKLDDAFSRPFIIGVAIYQDAFSDVVLQPFSEYGYRNTIGLILLTLDQVASQQRLDGASHRFLIQSGAECQLLLTGSRLPQQRFQAGTLHIICAVPQVGEGMKLKPTLPTA